LLCLNCGTETLDHSVQGRGRYKDYPDLKVCPKCWAKYTEIDGKWVRVSKTGKLMK